MSSSEGLLWDSKEKSYYRLTKRPDGRGERTYVRATTSSAPPRTSSNNPLALPLRTTTAEPGDPKPTQPPHPFEPYGSRGPVVGGNPRAIPASTQPGGATRPAAYFQGSSSLSSVPYGGQPAGSYATPGQYGYTSAGLPAGLGRGMSGLAIGASPPDSRTTGPTQTAITSDRERPSSNAPSARVHDGHSYLGRGTAAAAPSASTRQPRQQSTPAYSADTNVVGARREQVYTSNLRAEQTSSGINAGIVSAYGGQTDPITPQGTNYAHLGYGHEVPESPYLMPSSTAAPQRTSPFAVDYQSRSGGQISTGQRPPARNHTVTNRYRRQSSLRSETVATDITEHLIRGTEGETESLDSNYRLRSDHWKFFIPGRVFKVLWWEPQGSRPTPDGAYTAEKHGQKAFAKPCRFVVVRARPKQGYSVCLRISTYTQQGTEKSFVDQRQHAMIYTGHDAPNKLPGETKLVKDPIQVEPLPGQDLDNRSRVNCAKSYPIEHNVKVLEVGMVAKTHIRKLVGYWQNETEKDFPKERAGQKSGSSADAKPTVFKERKSSRHKK